MTHSSLEALPVLPLYEQKDNKNLGEIIRFIEDFFKKYPEEFALVLEEVNWKKCQKMVENVSIQDLSRKWTYIKGDHVLYFLKKMYRYLTRTLRIGGRAEENLVLVEMWKNIYNQYKETYYSGNNVPIVPRYPKEGKTSVEDLTSYLYNFFTLNGDYFEDLLTVWESYMNKIIDYKDSRGHCWKKNYETGDPLLCFFGLMEKNLNNNNNTSGLHDKFFDISRRYKELYYPKIDN